MTKEVYSSLLAIQAYLYREEEKHWKENGMKKNHIFNDVRRVSDWLDEVAKEMEA